MPDGFRTFIPTLCGGDAASTRELLDWTGDLLVHPDVKPGKAIALVGSPACGKHSFVQLLRRLIGSEGVRDVWMPSAPLRDVENALVVVKNEVSDDAASDLSGPEVLSDSSESSASESSHASRRRNSGKPKNVKNSNRGRSRTDERNPDRNRRRSCKSPSNSPSREKREQLKREQEINSVAAFTDEKIAAIREKLEAAKKREAEKHGKKSRR